MQAVTGRLSGGSEKIASFEVTMHRHFGSTLLHITDEGLILASSQRGIVFDIGWDVLYTATPKGKKIMFTWNSTSDVRFVYGIRVKDIDLVMHELQRLNAKFAAKRTFVESLKDMYSKEISMNANKIRMEFGKNKNRWHPTEAPNSYAAILEPSIHPVVASRHPDVPSSASDKYVWNDTWYNISKKCFFTHNAMFKKIGDFCRRAEQIKHKSDSPAGSISLEGLEIKFLFGYPATRLSWDGDGGAVDAWTLLPTMCPEMLTVEMALAKTDTDPSAHQLNYSTDSLEVYAPKFHSPVSAYEAILYNHDMRTHAIRTYPQMVDRLNYLRENIPLDGAPADAGKSSCDDEERKAHKDTLFLKWMSTVSESCAQDSP